MDHDRVESLKKFETVISNPFRDISLLDNALTHRSWINERQEPLRKDNERLEFLGDAVLTLCISDMLMKKFPDNTEGHLSKIRASVVNEQTLSRLGRDFRIGDYLLLGKGEDASGGRSKSSILANAMEALIAAIYYDGGYDKAYRFIGLLFEPLIGKEKNDVVYRDYKTTLQEWSQSRYKSAPVYRVVRKYGPDHDKVFQVSLSIGKILTTSALGKSKKEAEQRAARKATEKLRELNHE
jgi:ribonuclease III